MNKEKNLIDQRASLRVDTRETQQVSNSESAALDADALRPFLIGPEHVFIEQLCLLDIFKLAVSFVDVFTLGEWLCSRPMSTHSDAQDVSSAGYGSKLLIG